MKSLSFLKSPITVVTGSAAGGVIGVFFKQLVPSLKPFGDVYLSILQMCVFPIMISAIVVSISRLLTSGNGLSFIVKIIGSLVAALFLLSACCVLVSSIVPNVRTPSHEIKAAIGSMMSEESSHAAGFKHTQYHNVSASEEPAAELSDFFVNLIPKTFFQRFLNMRT